MKNRLAVVLLASFAAACGSSSPMAPSGPAVPMSVTGTWAGTASDSSSSMGADGLMGQPGMGTMTWSLEQTGSTVTG